MLKINHNSKEKIMKLINHLFKKHLFATVVVIVFLVIFFVAILPNISKFGPAKAVTSYVPSSATDLVVLNITVPDAWDNESFTADTEKQAGAQPYWQGDSLNSIPALETTSGVGYKDVGVVGFQGGDTEAVIIDLDADSVYTSAADTLVDGNGTTAVSKFRYILHSLESKK